MDCLRSRSWHPLLLPLSSAALVMRQPRQTHTATRACRRASAFTADSSRSGRAKRGPSTPNEAEAHRVRYGEDVEQDRGVELVTVQRLQQHLGAKMRVNGTGQGSGLAGGSRGIRAVASAWRINHIGGRGAR